MSRCHWRTPIASPVARSQPTCRRPCPPAPTRYRPALTRWSHERGLPRRRSPSTRIAPTSRSRSPTSVAVGFTRRQRDGATLKYRVAAFTFALDAPLFLNSSHPGPFGSRGPDAPPARRAPGTFTACPSPNMLGPASTSPSVTAAITRSGIRGARPPLASAPSRVDGGAGRDGKRCSRRRCVPGARAKQEIVAVWVPFGCWPTPGISGACSDSEGKGCPRSLRTERTVLDEVRTRGASVHVARCPRAARHRS